MGMGWDQQGSSSAEAGPKNSPSLCEWGIPVTRTQAVEDLHLADCPYASGHGPKQPPVAAVLILLEEGLC